MMEEALLVGLYTDKKSFSDVEEEFEELALLAKTAGAEVKEKIIQKRDKPTPSLYIGKGKAEEIKEIKEKLNANIIIFNDDLSPTQQLNLEEIIDCKVIDRTQLILDIFAKRAKTKEAELQVELAQLSYLLPRLKGKGILLSRLGGGIGTRGPGETKLEVDRRHIRNRIATLKKQLKDVRRHRELHREYRKRMLLPVCAIIGYTNAGKSTLLNTLSKSSVYVEDKLFATLDPTTKKITFPNRREVLLTDTVGFIRNLPPHLIAAFRATLEEVTEADILLHVVDASSENMLEQMKVVDKILQDIGANEKLKIIVYNKLDLVKDDVIVNKLLREDDNSVFISALYKINLDKLIEKIDDVLGKREIHLRLEIPQERGDILSFLNKTGKILSISHNENKFVIEVRLEEKWVSKVKSFTL